AADEVAHEPVLLDPVDADAVLDRHRDFHFRSYVGHTRRDQLRLRHQAGAKGAALHALARAADVEVDLVVAVALAELGAAGELIGLAAAELQRDRMLLTAEGEMAVNVAV